MTKLMTVTCLMQLVEQGKVGLHDDLRSLVPELGKLQILKGFDGDTPKLEDNPRPITLQSAHHHPSSREMQHTSNTSAAICSLTPSGSALTSWMPTW